MTIVTMPLSNKKQDQLKKPLVTAGADQNSINDVEAIGDPQFTIPVRAKVSTATLLALFLTSLLVLGIGIVSGLYLYRHYGQMQSHRVQGWFQIPAAREYLGQSEHIQTYFGSPEKLQEIKPVTEEYDIDVNANIENLNVPDFDQGRRGRFIHDFNANKTGIVDLEGDRCFVVPLNRARVLPPSSMFDLINKMNSGYYEVDTEIIRETYRVDLPPITKMQEMGKFISRECAGMPTYRLKRIRDVFFKRSLAESEEFGEFAGNKLTQYRIMMNEVIEYERDHPMTSSK